MQIKIEQHPLDPCARVVVEGSEEELKDLDLLYQAIMSKRHKEGKFETGNRFVVYFQLEPPLSGSN